MQKWSGLKDEVVVVVADMVDMAVVVDMVDMAVVVDMVDRLMPFRRPVMQEDPWAVVRTGDRAIEVVGEGTMVVADMEDTEAAEGSEADRCAGHDLGQEEPGDIN